MEIGTIFGSSVKAIRMRGKIGDPLVTGTFVNFNVADLIVSGANHVSFFDAFSVSSFVFHNSLNSFCIGGDPANQISAGSNIFMLKKGIAPTDQANEEAVKMWAADWNGALTHALFLRVEEGTEHVFGSNVGINIINPNSKLQVNGSFSVLRTPTAADYTSVDEVIIGVTSTSAARTITIATEDIVAGRIFIIKDESGAAATNNITIATAGAETIDGVPTITISANYGLARLYSDGVNLFTW